MCALCETLQGVASPYLTQIIFLENHSSEEGI